MARQDSFFGARMTRRTAVRGAVLASVGGVFAMRGGMPAFAHNAQDAAAYPEVVITSKEYAFEMPATIESGWTTVTLDNQGMMDHHAMLMRVNDGSTIEDLQAALQTPDFGAVFAVSTSLGGPMAGPVGKGSVTLNLEVGQYIAICAIPDDSGTPHYALGMAAPFEVTESAAAAEAPAADVQVSLVEMMFHGAPTEAAAGPQVWEITNGGAQIHEIFLGRLAEGVTFEQFSAMVLSAPEATPADMAEMEHATPDAAAAAPPFTGVGGAAPMSPGQVNYVNLDLEPGEHFAICFVPDPASGAPHAALGMLMSFTVA